MITFLIILGSFFIFYMMCFILISYLKISSLEKKLDDLIIHRTMLADIEQRVNSHGTEEHLQDSRSIKEENKALGAQKFVSDKTVGYKKYENFIKSTPDLDYSSKNKSKKILINKLSSSHNNYYSNYTDAIRGVLRNSNKVLSTKEVIKKVSDANKKGLIEKKYENFNEKHVMTQLYALGREDINVKKISPGKWIYEPSLIYPPV